MHVLVTGGAGYIGSHTIVQLLENGFVPIVIDNLSNSSIVAIERVRLITNSNFIFKIGDIRDPDFLENIFSEYPINCVIHFAGLKSVSESVKDPLTYYENNVVGTIQLLKSMSKYNIKTLIFSSSATVYGDPISLPLNESMPTSRPTNPYGNTKLAIENILSELYKSDNSWNIYLLRYFNPVGAHKSGLIGEDPTGIPNNLMPYISQVASGRLDLLNIYGNDYDTIDGTGVRDYIHVVDLADGHVKALMKSLIVNGLFTVNLGTGSGYSVLEVIDAFENVSGINIPYNFAPRRNGDVASCYADPSYALSFLDWEAKFSLLDMCKDTWRWQSLNPNGYE